MNGLTHKQHSAYFLDDRINCNLWAGMRLKFLLKVVEFFVYVFSSSYQTINVCENKLIFYHPKTKRFAAS